MHRFYVDTPLAACSDLTLDKIQSHQIEHVLRLKPGEALRVFNQGGEFEAVIAAIDRHQVRVALQSPLAIALPGAVAITLFVAMIKPAKMDWLVQKATELGVREIVPLKTKRSQVEHFNHERFGKIAQEATEQCERLDIPSLCAIVSLPDALSKFKGLKLVACERHGQNPLPDIFAKRPEMPAQIGLFIGPEGGWTEDEIVLSSQCGAQRVGLGKRILRTETACLTLLALVQHYVGEI